jgi:Dirigent-like protein
MNRSARRAAIIGSAALAVAVGTAGAAAAAPHGTASPDARTLTVFAFDINNGGPDPGFVPVPGTSRSSFAQGDELIINDQLTSTKLVGKGFPIIGHDSGVCTLTRMPERNARQTYANCVVTAVVRGGSLTVQGNLSFHGRQPQPTTMAVTGGTGRYTGAAGTVHVGFARDHKILTFRLR